MQGEFACVYCGKFKLIFYVFQPRPEEIIASLEKQLEDSRKHNKQIETDYKQQIQRLEEILEVSRHK